MNSLAFTSRNHTKRRLIEQWILCRGLSCRPNGNKTVRDQEALLKRGRICKKRYICGIYILGRSWQNSVPNLGYVHAKIFNYIADEERKKRKRECGNHTQHALKPCCSITAWPIENYTVVSVHGLNHRSFCCVKKRVCRRWARSMYEVLKGR